MENKDIINLLYETMKDRDVWFVTDVDYVFGKADCYKLNEYGKLADEKEENKVAKEITNYIGDGASNIEEAIVCWLNNAMYEDNSINFTDMLHMDFKDEPIIDGIGASTVDLEKRGGPNSIKAADITKGPEILTEDYNIDDVKNYTDNTVFECMDCGDEFEFSQCHIVDAWGNPSCPYCGSGDVSPMDEGMLEEDYIDEDDRFIVIETGLNDTASEEVLNSVIGQLSDGIWENSSSMNKYWSNMDIDREDGQLVVRCKIGYGSGFHDKDERQIRQWLANKVKQIVKEEELEWNRNNDTVACYLDRGKGTKVTVKDAYRVYDKLLGRIDRIQPKTEGLNDPVIDSYTTGKWKVVIKAQPGHKPVAYFYDMSQDKARFPEGQYTYSYYVDTLLGKDGYGTPIDQMSAFSLDTGVPAWTIEGEDLRNIANWLKDFDNNYNKEIKTESIYDNIIEDFKEFCLDHGYEITDKDARLDFCEQITYHKDKQSSQDAMKQIIKYLDSLQENKKITESVKQDLIDANIEDLTTDGGEDWIVFYLGDKELASYPFSSTFEGELPETREALAKENNVDIKDIKVKAITKPLTESEHNLSKDLFGAEAERRNIQKQKEYERDLQYVKDIMAGKKVIDDKYHEELSLETAKKWLRDDYIYINNLYSYDTDEINKRLAEDLPEIFGEKQEENFLMDKMTDVAKSNIELGSTVLGGLASAGLLASEETKNSEDKLEEAELDKDTEVDMDEEETVDTSVTPEDKLRKRTQAVYNLLTDNGLNVAISTDNGENQVEVILNDRDGKIIIPVREDNELEPITGGSISLDEDSLKILDKVKDILNSEEV